MKNFLILFLCILTLNCFGAGATVSSFNGHETNGDFYGMFTNNGVIIGGTYSNANAVGGGNILRSNDNHTVVSLPGLVNIGTLHATSEIVDNIETNIIIVANSGIITNKLVVGAIDVRTNASVGNLIVTNTATMSSVVARTNSLIYVDGSLVLGNDSAFQAATDNEGYYSADSSIVGARGITSGSYVAGDYGSLVFGDLGFSSNVHLVGYDGWVNADAGYAQDCSVQSSGGSYVGWMMLTASNVFITSLQSIMIGGEGPGGQHDVHLGAENSIVLAATGLNDCTNNFPDGNEFKNMIVIVSAASTNWIGTNGFFGNALTINGDSSFNGNITGSGNTTLNVNSIRGDGDPMTISGNGGVLTIDGGGSPVIAGDSWTFNSPITADGSKLTGLVTTNLAFSLIKTNFISGNLYVNDYNNTIFVSSSVSLTEAAVSGLSTMKLYVIGSVTNVVSQPTAISSLAGSVTNQLSGFVPAGATYTFTNTSTGIGNSSSTVAGSGQIFVY